MPRSGAVMPLEHGFVCFCDMKRDADLSIARDIGERMMSMRVGVFGKRSKSHVARLLGVSQSDITRWESGERVFTIAQAVRFARACGRDATTLFSGVAPALARQELLPLRGIEPRAAELVRDLVDVLRSRTRERRNARSARRSA